MLSVFIMTVVWNRGNKNELHQNRTTVKIRDLAGLRAHSQLPQQQGGIMSKT
jgi:hypothetical protein